MNSKMKTATFVKEMHDNFRGNARLYKLSDPLINESYGAARRVEYNHVVVSAAIRHWTPYIDYSGPETLIFGADKNGKVLEWLELPGSFRGALDHVRALHDAGYEIVE